MKNKYTDFDQIAKTINIDDFIDILSVEGKIFGEIKYNLSIDDLMIELNNHKDKFSQAKAAGLSLSQSIDEFDSDRITKIYSLFDNVNIQSYFIKENKFLKANKNKYSYNLLFAGL